MEKHIFNADLSQGDGVLTYWIVAGIFSGSFNVCCSKGRPETIVLLEKQCTHALSTLGLSKAQPLPNNLLIVKAK